MNSETGDLLAAWADGDRTALARVVTRLHSVLRRQARRGLDARWSAPSLSSAALVSEFWLEIVDAVPRARCRAEFLALSARTMRNLLVDRARHAGAHKRGAGQVHVPLSDAETVASEADLDPTTLLDLDAALCWLEKVDPERQDLVVKWLFGGCSIDELAVERNVSRATINRELAVGRGVLRARLSGALPE